MLAPTRISVRPVAAQQQQLLRVQQQQLQHQQQQQSPPGHPRRGDRSSVSSVPSPVHHLSEEDLYFLDRDLPYVRLRDCSLNDLGWPGAFGRWSPAANMKAHATIITLDGTTGGTAGPHRGKSHYLDGGTAGLYDELARRLPAVGVAVLQLAYRRPGPGRFEECVADASRAALAAASAGPVVIVGHSMGGAVALRSAARAQAATGRVLGVCTLATQLFGVPEPQDLALLRDASTLVVHGTADQALPPRCSEELAQRLQAQRLVLMPGATHCFEEHREELTPLVHQWILDLCSPKSTVADL